MKKVKFVCYIQKVHSEIGEFNKNNKTHPEGWAERNIKTVTDLKFSILKRLYKAKDNRWDKNRLNSKYKHKQTRARHAIEDFISCSYVKKLNEQDIKLTRKGEEAYEEEYDRRKHYRHNFIIALISVIAASIAALVPFIEFILSRFPYN